MARSVRRSAAACAVRAGRGECVECPHTATLAVLRAADALREAWGVRFPADDGAR